MTKANIGRRPGMPIQASKSSRYDGWARFKPAGRPVVPRRDETGGKAEKARRSKSSAEKREKPEPIGDQPVRARKVSRSDACASIADDDLADGSRHVRVKKPNRQNGGQTDHLACPVDWMAGTAGDRWVSSKLSVPAH